MQVMQPRRVIVWDVGVSSIIMLIGAGLVAFLALSAVALVMNTNSCASETCNQAQLNIGWVVAIIVPVLIMLASIVVAIRRMVRRRLSFWVPLAGIAVGVVCWFVGVLLVFESVPGFTP
jgi:hypothetical protein